MTTGKAHKNQQTFAAITRATLPTSVINGDESPKKSMTLCQKRFFCFKTTPSPCDLCTSIGEKARFVNAGTWDRKGLLTENAYIYG